MKTKSLWIGFAMVVVALFVISVDGCKKDETGPETITPITDDLFPLTVGHQIQYSGYVRDKTADTNITATGAVYKTTWFVAVNTTAPVPTGGLSHLIYDTTTVPTGIANPPTAKVITPLFVRRSSPTGSGNISFLQNIGRFYRTFGLGSLGDSLRWISIAQFDMGIGKEWIGFDSSWTTGTGTVRLQIAGQFVGTEPLPVGGLTFSTYKLTLVRRVTAGGVTLPDSPTATFWLVANVGPVKMILNADGESVGHYREYKSKNF